MSVARAWAIGLMMIPVVVAFNTIVWTKAQAPEAVTLPPQWRLPSAAMPKKPDVNDIVGLRLDYPSEEAIR